MQLHRWHDVSQEVSSNNVYGSTSPVWNPRGNFFCESQDDAEKTRVIAYERPVQPCGLVQSVVWFADLHTDAEKACNTFLVGPEHRVSTHSANHHRPRDATETLVLAS